MKKLAFIILAAFTLGCSDVYESPVTHYLIEAGDHSSKVVGGFFGDKTRTLKSDHFSFTARFDETARYQISKKNQADINKLMGFADANSLHHENSIRFGWRYASEKDKIEIFAYAYQNSELNYQYITDLSINEEAHFQILLTETSYELAVNGESNVAMDRVASNRVGVYYMLFPYFGGDETAPHRINVYIHEKL